jgi:hypothetical protein
MYDSNEKNPVPNGGPVPELRPLRLSPRAPLSIDRAAGSVLLCIDRAECIDVLTGPRALKYRPGCGCLTIDRFRDRSLPLCIDGRCGIGPAMY